MNPPEFKLDKLAFFFALVVCAIIFGLFCMAFFDVDPCEQSISELQKQPEAVIQMCIEEYFE